ncbi:DUF5365 family protein [Bacillus sp. 1P06AnD]|uniref:DUF5365 family protein n=1 Tax=Bacillus sp. 1P06AnD TaxID=3132208 RepID=UPI0039A305B9
MKIAFASTVEQREEIECLLDTLRTFILPRFFTAEELSSYTDMGLLQFSEHTNLYNDTLKEAYQLMTSLHIISQVINQVNVSSKEELHKLNALFERNASIVNEFGLFFPFKIEQFYSKEDSAQGILPLLSLPMNQILA